MTTIIVMMKMRHITPHKTIMTTVRMTLITGPPRKSSRRLRRKVISKYVIEQVKQRVRTVHM